MDRRWGLDIAGGEELGFPAKVKGKSLPWEIRLPCCLGSGSDCMAAAVGLVPRGYYREFRDWK